MHYFFVAHHTTKSRACWHMSDACVSYGLLLSASSVALEMESYVLSASSGLIQQIVNTFKLEEESYVLGRKMNR